MLQEKLNECRVLIVEVSENKQKDQENKNIAKRNNTFFDAYNKYFVPTVKSYSYSKKYNHIQYSPSIINDMKKLMDYSQDAFKNKTVVSPAKYQEGVKKLAEKIADEWIKQTESYLQRKKEELGILRLVSNNKGEIQKILLSLNNFCKWPLDQDITSQYDTALKKANKILLQMEFDDEIAYFLKKVKDKEATLLDLNDNIIAWIRKENLSGNIMLSIK